MAWHIEELTDCGEYTGDGIADGSTDLGLADAIAMIADMGRDGHYRVVDDDGDECWSGTRAAANAAE